MYIFNTYSAASGSLNASHKCEIAQQQRDGEIQVNKHVNSMEELLSVKGIYIKSSNKGIYYP